MEKRILYRFGEFSLDANAKVLLRHNQPVALARKAVETLLVLVESSGQVVPKESILRAVWTDRIVDEANLTQNIAVIRRALAVNRGDPAYIETFSGRGYRLIGPALIASEAPPAPAPPPAPAVKPPVLRYWPAALVLLVAVAGAAAWIGFSRLDRAAETTYRITPFTRLPGREFEPAVSPDGRRVAFLWEQEGGTQPGIWIKEAAVDSPRAVTHVPGHYSSPAWSPDGASLACLRIGKSSTEVVILSIDKPEEKVVTRFSAPRFGFRNRLLDWSPDGRYLAVAHPPRALQPLGIHIVSVTGDSKRALTSPGGDISGDVDPRFSPDGRTISFIRMFNRGQQELFTIPAAGGEQRQLTSDGRRLSGNDWIAGSKTVVFGSERGGEFRLWRRRGDGATPRAGLASTGIYGLFPIQFSLARQAPVLVYSLMQEDRNIWRFDLKDKKWIRLIASSGQDASPQYSPDGGRICFRSDRSGEEELWVSDAAGANPVQITRGLQQPSVGRWAPDSKQVVFNSATTGEIFVAASGPTGGWTVHKIGAIGVHPVFSRDGRWIFAGTAASIIRFPAAGGPTSEVAKTKALSLGLGCDGKFLYFVREATGTTLWKAPVSSGEPVKVLDGLIPDCGSCWAATPTGLYYLTSAEQSFDSQALYFHDFATGENRPVTEYPEPLWPLGSGPFSVSPDNRYLLCVRVEPSSSDVMRVEPFE